MKYRSWLAVTMGAMLLAVSGCSSIGVFKGQTTSAVVELSRKNYKIVKATAKGESSGFSLLGVIPIVSPTYAAAKEQLYGSLGTPVEGKAVALINQTEDNSFLYLVLFAIPRITVTADVIEYMDEPNPKP